MIHAPSGQCARANVSAARLARVVDPLSVCSPADPVSAGVDQTGMGDAGRAHNRLEQGRTMDLAGWAGMIVGLIVAGLVMYGVWVLIRKLDR